MSTTIPALNDVSDILDSDLCIVTHSNGDSYKISGAEINKRNQAIIAPDATPLMLTGAPLKTSNIIRVYWKVDLTSANGATALALSYNNVSYNVKVPRNGALASFLPFNLGNGVYKYLQAYTTLELLYDGTQFILLGNPVLISTANYTYTADGKGILDTVTSGNMHSVTSNAVEGALSKKLEWILDVTPSASQQFDIQPFVPDGIYLLFADSLWDGFSTFSCGIIIKYEGTLQYNVLVSSNNMIITTSGTAIVTNKTGFYGLKLLKVGFTNDLYSGNRDIQTDTEATR